MARSSARLSENARGDFFVDDACIDCETCRNLALHSWAEQARSMERLLAFDFEWVLPGHGPPFRAPPRKMRAEIERLVARMKR